MSVLVSAPSLDLPTIVAFLLLVGGVAGSFLPLVPSGLLSVGGVGLYWWGTGYTEPGTILLVTLVAVGVLVTAADWFSGLVAAKVGGASTASTALAGIVGFALLFTTGPLGMLVGSTVTVFVVELWRHRDVTGGATAAGAFVVGFFASTVVQALLTLSMLVVMVVVAL